MKKVTKAQLAKRHKAAQKRADTTKARSHKKYRPIAVAAAKSTDAPS